MKTKTISRYVCNSCGEDSQKWAGRCAVCGAWNSLIETRIDEGAEEKVLGPLPKPLTLSDVDTKNDFKRYAVGIGELDRVLGGGIVPGSMVLVGGDPGIGKSTLLLQVAAELAKSGKKVLYVSGEESLEQIKIRGERLGVSGANFHLLPETDVDIISGVAREDKPDLLIIDSIQTLSSSDIHSAPGNVAQISYTASRLQELAKKNHIATFLIGHVTKGGELAGPKVLEHLVDAVLYFEGDKTSSARMLRTYKNRFGKTSEMGIFEMVEGGLVEVSNPSEMLLSERVEGAAGTVIFPALEGSRPLLIEVQALTNTTAFPVPKRASYGTDLNRLMLLLAVLGRSLRINLSNQDVYINIVGGLKITEPAVDLALCLAVYSAYKNVVLPKDVIVLGEVGLSGEVRRVRGIEERLLEASKLGFKTAIVPKFDYKGNAKIRIIQAKTLSEAVYGIS